jgi:hypothetical protein
MRRRAIVLTAVLLPLSVLAGPPVDGVYQSTDLGGSVLVGRYSEGWGPGGGALLPGATLNAASWDGAALGTQWRYWCASETGNLLLLDTVDSNGNGSRTYQKNFAGGYIWLDGAGPWAGGDPSYDGVIDSYYEIETITYQNWQPVAAVTNVQATGHFPAYGQSCLTFSVGNGSLVGSTDMGMTKPAGFPGFLEEGTCDPVMPNGAWWEFFSLTLTISGCTNPSDQPSWGAIKAHYE